MARPSKIDAPISQPDGSTLTTAEAILRALRAGAYLEDAAEAAGVGKSTVYGWIERGNDAQAIAAEQETPVPDDERPFSEFSDAVEKARAEAVVFNLAVIRRAAQGQPTTFLRDPQGALVLDHHGDPIVEQRGAAPTWQAAAWYLERTRPAEYGRRGVDVRFPDGGAGAFRPAAVDLSGLSDDDLEAYERISAQVEQKRDG